MTLSETKISEKCLETLENFRLFLLSLCENFECCLRKKEKSNVKRNSVEMTFVVNAVPILTTYLNGVVTFFALSQISVWDERIG